jgi:S-methylmethionine-dependent homocysteine/selenocysteine methylase
MERYGLLRERIERGETVLLDGGIGAELVRRGIRWRGNGLLTDADAVGQVHLEFLEAGADLLRTNTFQLNRRTYLNVFRNLDHLRQIGAPGLEHRAADLTRRAAQLAIGARERSGRSEAAVAGVMSPLEHCFRPDLAPREQDAQREHQEQAELLAEGGVDLLLLESMNTLGEARAATRAARSTGLPVWVSFVVSAPGTLLGGESLAAAAAAVREQGAEAVLANCAPPEHVSAAVKELATSGAPFGAFAHLGKFDPPSWKFEFFPQFVDGDAWSPARYAAEVSGWVDQGARIVGGCCGAGPAHVQALRAEIRGLR